MTTGNGLDQVYGRSDRIVARRVAGEFILVPLVGRGADLDSIFHLNAVGAFVWERLDGRRSGADIVASMVERFEVDTATAEKDYVRFIEELRSIGALAGSGP